VARGPLDEFDPATVRVGDERRLQPVITFLPRSDRLDLIKVRGKGDKDRSIPFGEKTGQALTRYLRVRVKHKGADLPALFLSERGRKRLGRDGVKTMLRRRGVEAGIAPAFRISVPLRNRHRTPNVRFDQIVDTPLDSAERHQRPVTGPARRRYR
jgi:integrase